MTTVVAAVMRRSYTADMFDDLFGEDPVVPHTRDWDKSSGVTTLTFAGDLDPAIEQAVRCRMTSRDDADQAERAAMAGLRDELAVLDAPLTLEDLIAAWPLLRDAAVASLNYQLGEAP